MCDECKVAIAKKDQIDLQKNYQCNVCKKNFKTNTQKMQLQA